MALADGINKDLMLNYLVARTPEGLRRSVRRLQSRMGVSIKIENITFANGKWYAWYRMNAEADLQQEINAISR